VRIFCIGGEARGQSSPHPDAAACNSYLTTA